MAFTLPEFPLTVHVYNGPWIGKTFRLSTPANLAVGRRVVTDAQFRNVWADTYNGLVNLLFPPGTDVRDTNCNIPNNDIVEVPAGSGRWYALAYVDDLGKGFPNEHRYAFAYKISEHLDVTRYPGLFWPSPIP